MTTLFFFFALSILFSFLCSVWEAVILSVTPSYAKTIEKQGLNYAKTLNEFKDEIDMPLSAILSLNTVAHTVGAIGVGAQAGKVFGKNFIDLLGFQLSYESIIAFLMTLAILFLSEIIPKTLGANNWKALLPFTVRSLKIVIFLTYPLVWVSKLITKALKKDKSKSVLSRSDFQAMAEIGADSGAINQKESLIINNLLNLKEVRAEDIMTPKNIIAAHNQEVKIDDFCKDKGNLKFSRIPIFKDDIDNPTGFVLKDDILLELIDGKKHKTLDAIKRKLIAVKEDCPLPKLFDSIIENKNHIALVVNDFGAVVGLVTLEDVLETLLGFEILDEKDQMGDLRKKARTQWQERAKKIGLIE